MSIEADQKLKTSLCELANQQAKELGLSPIEVVRVLRDLADTYPHDRWLGL